MRWLAWLVAAAAASVVAIVFEPRYVLAPLLTLSVWKVGTAMLRSLAVDADKTPPDPRPVATRGERVVYWCEQCGAEMLLVVRGETVAPRHCGERMRERVEIPRNN